MKKDHGEKASNISGQNEPLIGEDQNPNFVKKATGFFNRLFHGGQKHKTAEEKSPERQAKKQAAAQQKEQDRQQIKEIREQNVQQKQQALKEKQNRKALFVSLPKDQKKTFLKTEKEEKKKKEQLASAANAKKKKEYAALTKDEKKEYRDQLYRQKQLKKRAKKGYVVRQVLKYGLLAVFVGVLAYAGNMAYSMFVDNSYAFQNTGQAVATPPPVSTETPSVSSSEEETAAPSSTADPYELLLSQADLDFMENRVNILVLGIDESLERADWGTFRTDTMILMSIDFDTNDVYMISLPRDSYVWIYNSNIRAKINSAFAAGGGKDGSGFEYAMNTVSMALGGIPVNHYICFDMNVVKEVVNAIGGLYYDVDVHVNMCGREIEEGYQYMDGQMVLDYCRQRKGDSDIARTDRQQRMILAIFEEVKNSGQIQDIPEIYSAITGNIYTDLDFTQIVSLAAFAMNIDLEDIQRYTLPGDFLNIDGTSFWGVNQYEKRDMVKEIFGVDISVSADDHVTNLQELAAQKRNVVAIAEGTAASAQAYVDSNQSYINAQELADFNTKTAELLAVAAVKNAHDVESTIAPITATTDEYNTWFASLQSTIEQRKAAAAATSTADSSQETDPSAATQESLEPVAE